jgi:arabinofuranosyltransferase
MLLWAGAGLEGPLFALLLTAGIYLILCARESGGMPLLVGVALVLVLLSLCRPEAAFLALLLGVLVVFQQEKARGLYRFLPVVGVVSVQVAYLLWRYRFYGELLPNTFYAKVGTGIDQLGRGLEYLGVYFSNFGGIILLVLAAFAWAGLRGYRMFLMGVPLVYLALVAIVGGDALPMYRFVVPVIPVMAVVFTAGLARLLSALQESFGEQRRSSLFASWALLMVVVAVQILPAYRGRQAQYVDADRERMGDRVAIGMWLGEHYPNATIAVNAAGAIPFYSGLNTIDMLGLNDRHIARVEVGALGQGVAGHEKFDPDYVLERGPDIIFIGRNELTLDPYGGLRFVWLEGDRRLQQHPVFKEHYQLVNEPVGLENFTFYLRKDTRRLP